MKQTLKTLLPGRYAVFVERLKNVTISSCCVERNVVDVERGNLDETSVSSEDEDFPDRVNNPQDYCRPLLPAHSVSASQSHNHKAIIIASYGIVENSLQP